MSFLSSFLLGLIQGVAEFLPISSSGHLAIAQNLLGMQEAKVIAMPPRKQASRWSWVKLASSVAAMTALLIAVGMYLFMQNRKFKKLYNLTSFAKTALIILMN